MDFQLHQDTFSESRLSEIHAEVWALLAIVSGEPAVRLELIDSSDFEHAGEIVARVKLRSG